MEGGRMNAEEVLNSVLQETIPAINEGDYFKDGVLYCGKCNTPKQAIVAYAGKVFKPRCLCLCEQRKVNAEEELQKRVDHERIVSELKLQLDPTLRNCTFEIDDGANSKVSSIAKNFVKHFDEMKRRGKGLLLYGTVGTGKTFISACICNALMEKEIPCYFTSLSMIVHKMHGAYSVDIHRFINDLCSYPLLVIDDFASERDTEYMDEMVQMVVDQLYKEGKSIIVTTNLTAKELKNPIDIKKERLYSRLLEMCIPVEVKGNDRRKAKLKNEYEELEELLGL